MNGFRKLGLLTVVCGSLALVNYAPSLFSSSETTSSKTVLGRLIGSESMPQTTENSNLERIAPYTTLVDRVSGVKEFFKQTYNGEQLHWLNRAVDDAGRGETWSSIETDLRIAKDYGTIYEDVKNTVRKIYEIGIRLNGPKKAIDWIHNAEKEAMEGETWSSIETDLRIAGEYATEAGYSLPEKARAKVHQLYVQGIKKHGPAHFSHWISKINTEVVDAETCLRIAGGYAKESMKPVEINQ